MNEQKTRLRNAGFVTFFFSGICAISSGVVVSLLQEQYGFAYGMTGTLLSLMSIGNLLAGFLTGVLPGVLGLKPSILLLTIGYTVGYGIMGFTGAEVLLAAAFFLVGVAKGSAMNACTILVSDNSADRTRGMNLMHSCYACGALLCPFFIAAAGKVSGSFAVLVLAVVGGTVGASLSQQHKSAAAVEKYGSNVLKLYLPGEYLGENVISDFEKQYGVRVIVENFDSNEMMYTKLMAGDRYDVIIPSDYMIERLMNEDFLQPLDKSMIPNMENMSDAVLGMSYDPDNTYSIPYFWGSVGLVYNHENVDPAVIESEGWEILRNTDYAGHIYIYDSERDSFMMAFKALGYSMNTEDPNEINAAYEWLLQMNNTMSPVYVTDEVIDGMMNGYKDIAVVYSGDAAVVLDENEDMSFYMPSQGTNIWCDAMVIPQNAENPKLAHEFINYMLTYEAAFDNTETVGYTSPNAEVFEEMTSSEDLYADNAAYLPRSGYDKDEMFHDNQVLMRELSKLWIKVKAAK